MTAVGEQKSLKDLTIKNYLTSQEMELAEAISDFGLSKSQEDLPSLFKEITKENKVTEINSNAKTLVLQNQSKLQHKARSNFQKALTKLKAYSGLTSKKGNSELSKDERTSVRDFYESFSTLKTESYKLNRNIRNAEGLERDAKVSADSCKECTQILSDLTTVGWTQDELNVLERTRSKRVSYRAKAPLNLEQVISMWGKWEAGTNPFYYFFQDENDYKGELTKMLQAETAYFNDMNNAGKAFCGILFLPIQSLSRACYGNRDSLKKAVENSKYSFQWKIGSKLMKNMNQLS
ncbi:hypothetical protein MHM_03530 [Candidatus Mycoplasma haemominutum 'Birmingham 1']|uniref:Uncharacterized protein n=2 Tax=Candidatus Mycoplasma haematominutum TaxID=209446 RepID=G8C3H3_9MOLU|nr:hypothetical protein MHM_03530 [Candidatus Mycoplasma haematominutum 'Birmingham 1']